VDDDDAARLLVKRALPEGASLEYASTLRDGLDWAELQDFDLILTDLRMPGTVNGDALTRMLDAVPHGAVMVFTALHYAGYACSLIRQGAVWVVFKPDAAIESEVAERLLQEAMLFAVARHETEQQKLLNASQNAQAIERLERELRDLRQAKEHLAVVEARRVHNEEDIASLTTRLELLQAQLGARQAEREKAKWGFWTKVVTGAGASVAVLVSTWLAHKLGWKP
jgi:DNA-binding NtrC family response regulator